MYKLNFYNLTGYLILITFDYKTQQNRSKCILIENSYYSPSFNTSLRILVPVSPDKGATQDILTSISNKIDQIFCRIVFFGIICIIINFDHFFSRRKSRQFSHKVFLDINIY